MAKRRTNFKQAKEYFYHLNRYITELGKLEGSAGVFTESGNAKKALWNEFGTRHITQHDYEFEKGHRGSSGKEAKYKINKGRNISIPARPFVRLYLYPTAMYYLSKEFFSQFMKTIKFSKQLNAPEYSARETMEKISNRMALRMRHKASTGGFASYEGDNSKNGANREVNAGLTETIKGFNRPLFETGSMVSSIINKVKRRGS